MCWFSEISSFSFYYNYNKFLRAVVAALSFSASMRMTALRIIRVPSACDGRVHSPPCVRGDKTCKVNPDNRKDGYVAAMKPFAILL